MKALIFSDLFFTEEVFERVAVSFPFWKDVERLYCKVGWPKVPFSYGGKRVQEYVPYPLWVIEKAREISLVITQMGLVDEMLIESAPLLQAVGCLRSGPVNVDAEYLTKKGIPLFFAPERSVEAVAEFTFGLMIAARRRMFQACWDMLSGDWNQATYFAYEYASLALSDIVVGLVGFGKVARQIARLLKAFGVREIVACDPFVEAKTMTTYGVRKLNLEELLVSSDIVSLHVRYSQENEKMIGAKEFLLMKKGSIFINTSRGKLVDEDALVEALRRGVPAFACIDTFCVEPCIGRHPLAELPNVVLTPHIAGACRSTVENGARVIAAVIADYFAGRDVSALCLNPEVLKEEGRCLK
ncbi:MAG: NAD(P)-dependent oxidoreductase [Candidatus Caldatribacteriaceae bacterium]